jgi:DNA mismatch endonuclease (patch repair protein)
MDKLTPERRSANMSRIRSRDTSPEMLVRRLVHGMGYRFRLHSQDLPGRPDLIFPGRQKVIFVHGCFWHSHGRCGIAHVPKSNLAYWLPKLERTKRRDAANLKTLRGLGWQVLTIWECQLGNQGALQRRLIESRII